jgi:hypothetical protein
MPTNPPELLFGPYRAPSLRKGDRATCLYRDCDVIVTGWTDAPIPWPRCRRVDVSRSHPSLLVDDELARAIRSESALALRYWWGVSVGVVARWRKALGVGRKDNPGSQVIIRAAAIRGKVWSTEEREERRRRAIEYNSGSFSPSGYHGLRWTAEQLALLDTAPDAEVAAQIGRTVEWGWARFPWPGGAGGKFPQPGGACSQPSANCSAEPWSVGTRRSGPVAAPVSLRPVTSSPALDRPDTPPPASGCGASSDALRTLRTGCPSTLLRMSGLLGKVTARRAVSSRVRAV